MSSRFVMPFADVGAGIRPASGAKLYFYELDGVTPKDTYSDQSLPATANTNPVISDSIGVFPDIFITGEYKVTLTNRSGKQYFGGVEVSEISGELNAVAIANNVAYSEVAYLATGAVSGIKYFFDATSQTTYAVNGTVTGTIVSVSAAGLLETNSGTYQLRRVNLTNNYVDVKDYGAICDGVTDDYNAVQLAIDSNPAGSTILMHNHLISESLYIDKTMTIDSVVSTIEMTTWGKPVYAIPRGIDDVRFTGKHKQIYTGARTYPIPVPTSADARIQAFYDSVAGSERIVCAGIAALSPNNNLYVEDNYAEGFFCGITMSGKVSATDEDSENVVIDKAHSNTVDWGVLVGGGVRDIHIKTLVADNVTHISPSDPSHAIYVGPRSAGIHYERVVIDNLLVNSCESFIEGDNTSDAFSIRSCPDAYIGKLSVKNSQAIGNARDEANLVIGEVYADLLNYDATLVFTAAVDAQSDSSITINSGRILSRAGVLGTVDTAMFSAASTASIHVIAGTYRNIRGVPGSFMRFGGVNMVVGSDVKILWDNPVVQATAECNGYIIYAYEVPGGFVLIDEPMITNNQLVFKTPSSTTNNWLLRIAPNKITAGLKEFSAYTANGAYRVDFTGFSRSPFILTDGVDNVEIGGVNTVKTANTSATSLSSFKRGSESQEYLMLAGDAVTGFTHGNFTNGFVASDGLNIAAGSWSSVKCIWLGDRLYELSRTL